MVLESNRDLVLRRLTEALARDRTRHQVSEVTSLGLVQLTRKRLGTGLIEAFSASCPHCAGRGILLHADPVDSSAAATGRKSESGGRRGRRSKKKADESPDQLSDQLQVAKVPTHAPGEHPMFKAMAAGSSAQADSDEDETAESDEAVAEAATGTEEQKVFEDSEEDTEDSDELDEDSDDDDSEDEDEDDLGDDDEDLDDDDGDLDLDDDLDLEDSDSDDDSDDDDSDSEADTGPTFERPRRRRAAGRPAGPPIHVD
jgi:ribonuclease E